RRVGGSDRLRAGGLECDRERVSSLVGGGERKVGGQDGLAVAARKMDGPNIASRHVAQAIDQSDRYVLGGSCRRTLSEAAELKGHRYDVDGEIGGGRQGTVRRISGAERLGSRCLERGLEIVFPQIRRGELVIGGQHCLAVAARKVDGSHISGRDVAKVVN